MYKKLIILNNSRLTLKRVYFYRFICKGDAAKLLKDWYNGKNGVNSQPFKSNPDCRQHRVFLADNV
jgi:hypothetical protein